MSKPTLLTWHDFIAPTGFGNVAKNLLQDAYKQFDVTVVAINSKDPNVKYDKKKYKKIVHTLSKKDPLNMSTLVEEAEKLKPDVIFLFQDIFNIDMVIEAVAEASPDSKIVTYFPIDGHPLFTKYKNIFKFSDVLITYSDWAIDMINDYLPDIDKPIYKLYHGVDTDTFKPLNPNYIESLRKPVKWLDKLVFVNINSFQPRKQIDLGIRAFSMFAKGYKRCDSCDHMQPRNIHSCELCMSRDLEDHPDNKDDVMLYLHMMAFSPAMGTLPTDNLISHMENANLTRDDYSRIVSINGHNINKGEISEEVINEIYNSADYNISTTMGEGCGLSLLESAACGVESIAPKNSAIPEMLGPFGHMVKNRAVANFKQDNGHIRPIVDERHFVQCLEDVYADWVEGGRKKQFNQEVVDRIKDEFLWDDKREFLMDKLTGVIEE